MRLVDLFSLADKYCKEGNMQMAIQLWTDLTKQEVNGAIFAAAHLNLADVYKKMGNIAQEKNELIAYLNSVQSIATLKAGQNVEVRLKEIEGQLNPPQAQIKDAPLKTVVK